MILFVFLMMLSGICLGSDQALDLEGSQIVGYLQLKYGLKKYPNVAQEDIGCGLLTLQKIDNCSLGWQAYIDFLYKLPEVKSYAQAERRVLNLKSHMLAPLLNRFLQDHYNVLQAKRKKQAGQQNKDRVIPLVAVPRSEQLCNSDKSDDQHPFRTGFSPLSIDSMVQAVQRVPRDQKIYKPRALKDGKICATQQPEATSPELAVVPSNGVSGRPCAS